MSSLPEPIRKSLQDLPMLSEVAAKLLAISQDKDHSAREILDWVEKDVYLSSRVMRVANSAYYSRGQEITSLQRAVMHLGESLVISIALQSSMGEMLSQPLAGYESAEGALWAHCLQVALASREVARLTKGKVDINMAYTAGLLVDVGMAVMSPHMEKDIARWTKLFDEGEVRSFVEAERESTGTDHAQISGEMARNWNLPDVLVATIRHHHRPSQAPEEFRSLVYTVHLGDMIARMAGFGVGAEALSYPLDEGYVDYISMSRREMEEVMLHVVQAFSAIEQSMME